MNHKHAIDPLPGEPQPTLVECCLLLLFMFVPFMGLIPLGMVGFGKVSPHLQGLGRALLLFNALLTLVTAILVFWAGYFAHTIAMALWGIAMGFRPVM